MVIFSWFRNESHSLASPKCREAAKSPVENLVKFRWWWWCLVVGWSRSSREDLSCQHDWLWPTNCELWGRRAGKWASNEENNILDMMDLRFIHSADQKTESRVRGLQSSKRFHFSSNKRERFKLSLNSLKRDLPISFSGPFFAD